jgi:hypothetical protein
MLVDEVALERAEVSSPTWSVTAARADAGVTERGQQLGREVQPGRRGRRRSGGSA